MQTMGQLTPEERLQYASKKQILANETIPKLEAQRQIELQNIEKQKKRLEEITPPMAQLVTAELGATGARLLGKDVGGSNLGPFATPDPS